MTLFLKTFLKAYAVLVTLFASMVGTHLLLHKDTIFPDPETVVVYGRDSCGITTSMRGFLDRSSVPYVYRNIDRFLASEEMWYHLDESEAQDFDPEFAALPVVLVNGHTLEGPRQEEVLELYRQRVTSKPE